MSDLVLTARGPSPQAKALGLGAQAAGTWSDTSSKNIGDGSLNNRVTATFTQVTTIIFVK